MSAVHEVIAPAVAVAARRERGREYGVRMTLTDKPQVTRRFKRRKRVTENDEYGEFIARIVRAYARRVAAGDIEALASLAELEGEVRTSLDHAVAGLRADGYSWGDIGRSLGVTRQSAQERFGSRP